MYVHAELKRPGVTLEVLHLKYLERHPDGYRYTVFCDTYREWLALVRAEIVAVVGDLLDDDELDSAKGRSD